MGEENPEGSDVRTDGIGIAVVYELVPPIAEPGVTRSSTWSWPALQSWSAGSGGLSDAGATIEDWSLDLTRGVGMGLAPKGTYSRRHAPARRRETVTEEPRNAKDISRDYKSLDDTAGSTAPDDPRSSGADSGLTAGGMGTGVEGGDDSAGGSPGNQGGATTGGTSSGSIGGNE